MANKNGIIALVLLGFICLTDFSYADEYAFKPNSEELNDVLFKLYSEIKCPPKYHIKSIEFPYAYCINKLYYDVINDIIVLEYNVYRNYKSYLSISNLSEEKQALRELIKRIGSDLGVDVFGLSHAKLYGTIDRLNISNITPFNFQELTAWREYIRKRIIIELIHINRNKEWHQAANGLNKQYFYSKGKRPKNLNKLIGLNR